MTQTHQQRKQRPGWATYKNRKKTLRQRLNAGTISVEQHAALMTQARERYRQSLPIDQRIDAETRWAAQHRSEHVVEQWLDDHPDDPAARDVRAGSCMPLCVAARGPKCQCWCEGVNHGAASGYDGPIHHYQPPHRR